MNIVGGGSAHGEPGESANLEHLTSHQMKDVGPHHMDFTTMPLLLGVGIQEVEVFVVTADKQGSKGLVLQPVQFVPVRLLSSPHPTEISRDDHAVLPVHPFQSGKVLCGEPLKIAMSIARDPDAHIVPLLSMTLSLYR